MNSRNLFYIASIFLFGCGNPVQEPVAETPVAASADVVTLSAGQLKNIHLKTDTLRRQNISGILRLSGQVDVPPQNLVSVSIPLGGYLKSTDMLPGTHVRKGQLLAVMEDPQYIQLQQDYLTTRNKLNYAGREYERQKELNSSKAASDKVMQQAESEYRNLSIESKALAAKLSLLGINADRLTENNISRTINIHSPITGYINKVNVNIGKYVTPSDVIFELVNPVDIHLNLTVYEKDLDKLSIGQQVSVYTNAKPDQRYDTKIILISHSLNENRSAEVHCHFEQYDKSLVPGMYMNAEVRLQDNQETVLPEVAIVNFESKDYVFVEEAERTYRMVAVQKGQTDNGVTVVPAAGLTGRRIVTEGAYSLLMQLKNTGE
ncbi:efflux RND transporter periplasmic adaptor subunit [Chitinophaga horti]|uniref:Efflux RND transporter periplasmic adaptor subunit n=1 Tax=Chitinophaga horti TaxID=2920382 RepID=A0ABY6J7P4_9BACT|nr:efflux RND transporter periplasmic adaptor subunit [Chitinophaga horti]UYQ95708.1 efflux RND transporter periplasmic adaptor subunit [Chitinophaga horti]